MKKRRITRTILSLLMILIQLASLVLVSYSIILYKGVETFYRAFGILILLYFFFFFSYLLLRSIKRKGKMSFIVPFLLSLIISASSIVGYYYLHKIYTTIDAYSKKENMYYILPWDN